MSEHKAIVAKIDRVIEIPNADRVHVGVVLGEHVIVGKNWGVGKVGVFFPAELQLSEKFCYHNNLHRHANLNEDKEKTGFFDDNRRVRAQPFLKVKSCGFFTDLTSLDWTSADTSTLQVGDMFDNFGGEHICQKYINENTRRKMANGQTKAKKKVDAPDFAEHKSTAQIKHHIGMIQPGSIVSIQSKRHGTSHRSSYTRVRQDLNWFQKALNSITGKEIFPEFDYEYLTGSRRVVLHGQKKEIDGYHGSNGFRFEVTDMLKPYMNKGMSIYGEVCGYANGSPIMGSHSTSGLKDKKMKKKYGDTVMYKYGCLIDTYRFHVYRITMTTAGGDTIDMTQPQLVQWCLDRGIEPSTDLITPFIYDGSDEHKDYLLNTVEELTERPDVLTEDYIDSSHINEGVIVRVDDGNLTPTFYKNKSWAFKVLEGIAVESGEIDEEDAA